MREDSPSNRPQPMTSFAPDQWSPPFYELRVEFDSQSPTPVARALTRLWSHPSVHGPYSGQDLDRSTRQRVKGDITERDLVDAGHLFGVATLRDGHRVPSGSIMHLPDDRDYGLTFYVPCGALHRLYNFRYPPDHSWRRWSDQIDEWLADIGRWVYEAVPFALGVIGVEPETDLVDASTPDVRRVAKDVGIAILLPVSGRLHWHPR